MTIFLGEVPGVAAYFSSWDEYPRAVYRYSNEREMFHVNFQGPNIGPALHRDARARVSAHGLLAPESAMETWLDEGFAELATRW